MFDGLFLFKCLLFGSINLYCYFWPPYWSITETDFQIALINIGFETSVLTISAQISRTSESLSTLYIPLISFGLNLISYLGILNFSILEGLLFLPLRMWFLIALEAFNTYVKYYVIKISREQEMMDNGPEIKQL